MTLGIFLEAGILTLPMRTHAAVVTGDGLGMCQGICDGLREKVDD